MERLLTYVDMQFNYLNNVVLSVFWTGRQGRTVSLISYTLYKYIGNKEWINQ